MQFLSVFHNSSTEKEKLNIKAGFILKENRRFYFKHFVAFLTLFFTQLFIRPVSNRSAVLRMRR